MLTLREQPEETEHAEEVEVRQRPRGEASAFDIEAAELPEAIEEAAFRSGGYPYAKRMKRKRYERELQPLQIELLKLQHWAREKGERIVIVFEGRDGGRQGRHDRPLHPASQSAPGPRRRAVQALRPRGAASGISSAMSRELPTAGEIALFDRSWYNRAGVERVMGFCTPEETETSCARRRRSRACSARDGIRLSSSASPSAARCRSRGCTRAATIR